MDLGDMLKMCAIKEYSKMPYRALTGRLRLLKKKLKLERIPHFNTIRKYMLDVKFQKVITKIIKESAKPLAKIERIFAIDSTGFGTSAKIAWIDVRYKKHVKRKDYSKLHAIAGYLTGIIPVVKVTKGFASDCKQFKERFTKLADNFTVDEISGDKAYLSKGNVNQATDNNSVPYFRPKDNTALDKKHKNSAWNQMLHSFFAFPENWLKHYHKRSNIESVFSTIKRKHGGRLRSKKPQARTNELLIKILAYNITILNTAKHQYQL